MQGRNRPLGCVLLRPIFDVEFLLILEGSVSGLNDGRE
jgi:hypothetical protein